MRRLVDGPRLFVTGDVRSEFAELFCENWLADGQATIGQIAILCRGEGFRLRHRDDLDRENLQLFECAAEAAELAQWDAAGKFRPLKTAPSLPRGWELRLKTAQQLLEALEHFYPGRLDALNAWRDGILETTSLRATLNRQSGMYRVAARINNAQIDEVVARTCRSADGCLRTILWARDDTGAKPTPSLPPGKFDPAFDQLTGRRGGLPLLCQEICPILVSAARAAVKADSAETWAE